MLRWRYATDGAYLGRGVYVDDIRVATGGHVLLDGEKAPGDFVEQGWTLASR